MRRLADASEDLDEKLTVIAKKLNHGVADQVLKKAMKKYHKRGELNASEVTMSQYSPTRYVGSVSESFAEAREKACVLSGITSIIALTISST